MAHASNAAGFSNVCWNPFKRHDGHGTGVFCDSGLFGVNDVHDDAALLHSGKASLEQITAHS
jgi:hypothetical protein